MRSRSLPFVPGDSRTKLARAADRPADALILDLEDPVVAAGRTAARQIARAAMVSHDRKLPAIGGKTTWS